MTGIPIFHITKFYFSALESASAVTSKSINEEDNLNEGDDGGEETSESDNSEEVLVANGEDIKQQK